MRVLPLSIAEPITYSKKREAEFSKKKKEKKKKKKRDVENFMKVESNINNEQLQEQGKKTSIKFVGNLLN